MKSALNSVINSKSGFDTVPVRIGVGVIFAAHGAQKLFGWLGGYGLRELKDGWLLG